MKVLLKRLGRAVLALLDLLANRWGPTAPPKRRPPIRTLADGPPRPPGPTGPMPGTEEPGPRGRRPGPPAEDQALRRREWRCPYINDSQ